jgi:hypothetical protein
MPKKSKNKILLRQSNNREALYFNKIKIADKQKLEPEDYLNAMSKIVELNLDYKIEIFVENESNPKKINDFFQRLI